MVNYWFFHFQKQLEILPKAKQEWKEGSQNLHNYKTKLIHKRSGKKLQLMWYLMYFNINSPLMAVECHPPQDIDFILMPSSASSNVGLSWFSIVPCPSCPRLNEDLKICNILMQLKCNKHKILIQLSNTNTICY